MFYFKKNTLINLMELVILTGLIYAGHALNEKKKKKQIQNYRNSKNTENIENNIDKVLINNNTPDYYSFKENNLNNVAKNESNLSNDFLLNTQNMYTYGNYKEAKKAELNYASEKFNKTVNFNLDKNYNLDNFDPYKNLDTYNPDFNYIQDIEEQDEKRMFMRQTSGDWHNNMNPFYGSSVKQNTTIDANEPLLGRYTAEGDDIRLKKEEVPNMFTPEPNTLNVFGDTSQIKNYDKNKSRYIPSLYQQNVTPIESTKIGPGLNIPTDVVARDGWQEMTRILPPTTNEIRTINKPKEEFKGRTVLGKYIISNRSLAPTVHKNRPEKFTENKSGERNFVTTGAVLKAMAPAKYNLPDNNRSTKINVVGPAFNGSHLKCINRDFHKQKSKKNTFENHYVGPCKKSVPSQLNNKKETYFAKNTFRQEYESYNPISNIISQISKAIMRPLDKTKDTKKQLYELNNRQGESLFRNSKNTVHYTDKAKPTLKHDISSQAQQFLNTTTSVKAPKIYNSDEKLKTTIRETTLGPSDSLNLKSGNFGIVYDPSSCAKITQKEQVVTSTYDNTNLASTTQGNIVYNLYDLPKVTIRETTTKEAPLANLSSSTQGQIILPEDEPKITIKQEILGETPFTNLKNNVGLNPVFDPEDKMKITMKETTIFENQGSSVSGQLLGNVYDPNNIAKQTIKQTLLQDTPISNLFTNVAKNYVYDNTILAKTTIKESTMDETPLTNLHATSNVGVVYDPNIRAKSTINESTISEVPLANLKSNSNNHMVYNILDKAKSTIKETTLGEQPLSNLHVSGGFNTVYNSEEKAKLTIKETTLGEQPISNLSSNVPMNLVYNPEIKAKQTTKETTLEEQPVTNFSTNVSANKVFNPNDIAKRTVKETTHVENYVGNVSAKDLQEGAYNVIKIKPRYTTRQDIESSDSNQYYGSASNIINKSNELKSYYIYKNTTTNALKEQVAEGREPTLSGAKVYHSKNSFGKLVSNKNSEKSTAAYIQPSLLEEFEHFKMIQNNETTGLGNVTKINKNIRDPTALDPMGLSTEFGLETKSKNMVEKESFIDPSLLTAFHDNPYTQPLNSAV